MKKNEYEFSGAELEAKLPEFVSLGITELTVNDSLFAEDRGRLIHFLKSVKNSCPDLLLSIRVEASVFDRDVCTLVSGMNCAVNIPLRAFSADGRAYRFDRKMYAGRAKMMNDAGLVFGFVIDYARCPGDSLKNFRDRLDFALMQYPNHIDFPQTENAEEGNTAKTTALFSAQDIRYARDISFACRTFYTAGRAVPWFLSVLRPLKINGTSFFSDFAEWQLGSSCGYVSGYVPEDVRQEDIEKMQLLFLGTKYEEKGKRDLFPVVQDIVKINGAFSRLAGEGEECIMLTQYNPDDLLGPESEDISVFAENVCMEECSVKIYNTPDGPDYKILA